MKLFVRSGQGSHPSDCNPVGDAGKASFIALLSAAFFLKSLTVQLLRRVCCHTFSTVAAGLRKQFDVLPSIGDFDEFLLADLYRSRGDFFPALSRIAVPAFVSLQCPYDQARDSVFEQESRESQQQWPSPASPSLQNGNGINLRNVLS